MIPGVSYPSLVDFGQLTEELRTLAELALANARRELEQTGKLNPSAGLRWPDTRVTFVSLPDKLADAFFADGDSKEAYFDALRLTVTTFDITAVILVHDMWTGRSNEKFRQLPRAERERIIRQGPSIARLEGLGYMERCEAVMVSVQTPDKVAMIEQLYDRGLAGPRSISWGERTAKCFDQADFDGRMKMYGKEAKTQWP